MTTCMHLIIISVIDGEAQWTFLGLTANGTGQLTPTDATSFLSSDVPN